jgi:RNA-binding protein YhbY
MDTEIAIRLVGRKNKDQVQKLGMCMIKYKDKWQRILRKSESDAELNVDG